MGALPVGEYGTPGPLRDRLVAAILSGQKTATSSLYEEYRRFGEDLPQVGQREIVLDSHQHPVCLTETVAVEVLPVSDMKLDFALAEGEGFTSVDDWWAAHRTFWGSEDYRTHLGQPEIELDENTLVVCQWFRMLPLPSSR
ncbi:ASCH domain-containing protein [Rothia sp. CCM 9417]|uniref:ASCH domain-containing protein n=1 Tax=Rothia sp. CCM 9417 TaxID=3402657 RepID=UPI003ADB1265